MFQKRPIKRGKPQKTPLALKNLLSNLTLQHPNPAYPRSQNHPESRELRPLGSINTLPYVIADFTAIAAPNPTQSPAEQLL